MFVCLVSVIVSFVCEYLAVHHEASMRCVVGPHIPAKMNVQDTESPRVSIVFPVSLPVCTCRVMCQ